MMQKTFGPIVGLDPEVPIRRHPNDMIVCADTGNRVRHADCHYSADDEAWEDESERNDHDVDLLRTYFEGVIEWSDDWHASDDAADHLVQEGGGGYMRDNVKAWFDNRGVDYDDYPKDMIADICADHNLPMEVSISHGCFGSSDHDVTFDSYDCGECEEQVDLSGSELLTALHDRGDLEDLLEEIDREFCFYRNSKWDPATKTRTEGSIVSEGEYPCIMLYNCPDVWYHFGCSDDELQEVWGDYMEQGEE